MQFSQAEAREIINAVVRDNKQPALLRAIAFEVWFRWQEQQAVSSTQVYSNGSQTIVRRNRRARRNIHP